MFRKQLLALCTLLTLVTACSKKDKDNNETSTVTAEVKAVQEYLSVTTGLTIFAASFKEVSFAAADVSGGITVFAPDNSAITNYDPNTRLEAVGLTTAEIKDHIVKGIIKRSDLTNGKKLSALSGKELLITVDGDNIYINGVLIADVNEDVAKQVVYKISNVLCRKPGAAEISVYDGTQWSANDTQGKLTADADVALYYSRTDFKNNQPAFIGKTNASGKITFSNLAPGIYYLIVKKDEKYNYFEPDTYNGKPMSYKPVGIFQSTAQVNGLPALPNSAPGDFIYQDTNGDGKIDANDKTYYPFEVVVTSNKTVQVTSFIGYTLNHLGAVFGTKAEVQLFLDNLYATVGSWHQLQTVIDGVLSDDADCSISPTICPLDNFTLTPTNSFTTALWTAGYNFITSTNRVIQNVPAMNLSAAEANELIAQAKGLRAFIYYELATYYGALPLYTKVSDVNLARSPLADTYTFIKKDLSDAVAILPARYTGADHRRIGADACKMLQARIAMAQGDNTTAKQITATLIQNAAYSLVSTGSIFVSDENAEIIWNLTPTIASAYNAFFSSDGTGKTFLPAIRYAEVLLINSEARVNLGELDPAYVNQLLSRRGQQTVSFTSVDQARDVVQLAWKNELHHEGHRFAKVVKWGIAMQVVGSKGYHDYNSLMPVPQSILVNNPNMTQNVGY